MLVIRLQRTGRKNIAAYRLVCTEKNSPPKGKVKEFLGHYLPTRNPHVFECKKERVEYWISVGAQPSNTVARLLNHDGMKGMEKFIDKYTKKSKRKQVEEAKATTPAPKPPETTKPSEEPKSEDKPSSETDKKREGSEDDKEGKKE